MRTFVLLQCIHLASSLRSQASPSRGGSLIAGRRLQSAMTSGQLSNCDIAEIQAKKKQLPVTLQPDTDDVDRFIADNLEYINGQIVEYQSQMEISPVSANVCPPITLEGEKMIVFGKTIIIGQTIVGGLKKRFEEADPNIDFDALSEILNEMLEDVMFTGDEEDTIACENLINVADKAQEEKTCVVSASVSSVSIISYEKDLKKCEDAKRFLLQLQEDKNKEKEADLQHKINYEKLKPEVLFVKGEELKYEQTAKSLGDDFTKLKQEVAGLQGDTKDLQASLDGVQGKLKELANDVETTNQKFNLMTQLLDTAENQKKSIVDIEKKVQAIIGYAVMYHQSIMRPLILWYEGKPKQPTVDSAALSNTLDQLTQQCDKYNEHNIVVQDNMLEIKGKKLPVSLDTKMQSVITGNSICGSLTRDKTPKFLEYFGSQMTREWRFQMKQVDSLEKAFKGMKIEKIEEETDIDEMLGSYLRVFSRKDAFYRNYLKYWIAYFPEISRLVMIMSDEVRKFKDELSGNSKNQRLSQENQQQLLEELTTKMSETENLLAERMNDMRQKGQAYSVTESKLQECKKKMLELDNQLGVLKKHKEDAKAKYANFITEANALLAMHVSRIGQ